MSAPLDYWFSPFSFPGTRRSLQMPQQVHSSSDPTISSNPIMLPSIEKEDVDIWEEEVRISGEERQKPSDIRLHSLFHPDESPMSSPTSESLSDDNFESLSHLQHPRPTPDPTLADVPLRFGPDFNLECSKAKEDDIVLSRSPSLVPTVIDSRPTSPDIHPCIAEAKAFGILVRDFAFEEHGVPMARPVPDIETLKNRYQLYRSANLTPPNEVVDTLHDYDYAWFSEKKLFYDNRHGANDSKWTDSNVSDCRA